MPTKTTTAATLTQRARNGSRRSGVAFSPRTKNGSSPNTRARSRVSPSQSPASRLSTIATTTPPHIGRKIGVISRQKNSAERYHSGQWGSANRSSRFSPPTCTRNSANAHSKIRYGTTTVRNSCQNRCGV